MNDTTISEIAEWAVATHLKRTDMLAVANQEAVNVYKMVCAKVPFDELQEVSAERAVNTTNSSYSIADLSPELAAITSIRMTYATGQVRRLKRSTGRVFDQLPYTNPGRPARYARRGHNLEFDRTPDSASYTYRIRYWARPTIAEDMGTTILLTPGEWDELFRWETLRRVYIHLEKHQEAMMLVTPAYLPRQPGPQKINHVEPGIIPSLWNDLLKTQSQREAPDEDFGINPTISSYTAVRG